MPKNKIQFQKGLSLQQFNQQYGTNRQCQDLLFQFRWPQGFSCPRCGHKRYSLIQTRALYQCSQCRHQCSLISGTIFASTKLPLKTWFLAIYFITQSKDGISSLNLARTLGISANTAQRVKHKLQQVMKQADDSLPLPGIIQLDDSYWGGKKHGCKRGRGAAGKVPFLAAVSTNIKGQPIYMRLSRIKAFTTAEVSRWSLKHLHHRSIVVSDGYYCFRGVAQAGFLHESIVTGGGYKSMEINVLSWVNLMLGNVKRSLHGTYHSMSPRHLPRYLAEFCYRFNRRFRMGEMIPSLVRAAIKSMPIPQHQLKLAEDWW